MDKYHFARDVGEKHTLGSAAAQRSFKSQLVLASSLLMFCYLPVAILVIQWAATQVNSGPGQVGAQTERENGSFAGRTSWRYWQGTVILCFAGLTGHTA